MNQNQIRSMSDRKRPQVQLDGLDILGRTREAMKSCGWSKAEIVEFTNKAMAGDYVDLIGTVCNYCEVD